MSKVKLTERQADVLEKAIKQYGEDLTIIRHAKKYFNLNCEKELFELTTAEVAKAIYIGYEIEPEFKVGDWIVVEDCPCKRIIGKVQKIKEVEEYSTFTRLNYDRDWFSVMSESKIRHATPEEITKEKQRRFWSGNNRDLWHIKRFDILKDDRGNSFEVNGFYGNGENKKVLFKGAGFDFMSNVKDLYKIVCFAEDRKDL